MQEGDRLTEAIADMGIRVAILQNGNEEPEP